MPYTEETPFYQLLATKYDAHREQEAIEILNRHPEIAQLEWPGPDSKGEPFVKGSTAGTVPCCMTSLTGWPGDPVTCPK